jgi:hypothetical protein
LRYNESGVSKFILIFSTEFILDLVLMCSPGIVGIEPGATRPKRSSIPGGCEG